MASAAKPEDIPQQTATPRRLRVIPGDAAEWRAFTDAETARRAAQPAATRPGNRFRRAAADTAHAAGITG